MFKYDILLIIMIKMDKRSRNIIIIIIVVLFIGAAFAGGYYYHEPIKKPEKKYMEYLNGIPVCDVYYKNNLKNLLITGPSSYIEYANNNSRDNTVNGNLSARWTLKQSDAFEDNISVFYKDFKELGYGWIPGYTQMVGDVVAPTIVNGIVYITSSDGMVYGINDKTGNVIFSLSVPSSIMSETLVYKNIGYVGLGSAFFTYDQGLLNAFGGGYRGRYSGLTGILAFNATTGRPLWLHLTKAQAMPTGVIANNQLIWDDGDGNIYSMNLTNGNTIWKYHYNGSANMASLLYYRPMKLIIAGFSSGYPTNMSAFVELYTNGTLYKIIRLPFAATSGAGDAVPAIYNGNIVDTFTAYPVYYGPELKEISIKQAFIVASIKTGKIIINENLTKRFHVGGTNNGNSPLIINGIAYVPSIIDHRIIAVNVTNGRILWKSPELSVYAFLHDEPAYYNNMLFVPDLNNITIINATTGSIIANYTTNYIYAIQQPLIVGNTLIEDSITNYAYAVPLKDIIK
ncbi:Outer membrane protein assembly factor BamB, contains PQQ-like beta-propeller repeat [Picrophilus oshimae DSM 9789]|uniref:Outer membrane protein assembly factor BamB, contains PQQ-like beta-propeller repeat n=2 Tax=Picrophilus oshimae TaxID=46632 RepID=A0A8G2L6S1_PICTO|nr:Outer membrane protein assembly factor BamB, contains PQQ-like beta-propeller repeat [Picrophilus oshimae DSM 9789]